MDRLLVKKAGQIVGEHPLAGDAAPILGRSKECDVVLEDMSISRRHAQVAREGSRYRLSDLGSANGIFVAGERVQSCILEPGQSVAIGGFTIELERDPTATDTSESTEIENRTVLLTHAEPWALEFVSGGRSGERLDLAEGDLTIGRDVACALVIPDRTLSRRHALLRVTGSQVTIEDLGSSNGTKVNGRTIQDPQSLLVGDEIELGSARLRLVRGSSEITSRPDWTAAEVPAPIELPGKARRRRSPLVLVALGALALWVVVVGGMKLLEQQPGQAVVPPPAKKSDPLVNEQEENRRRVAAHLEDGQRLLAENKPVEALEMFRRALSLDPSRTDIQGLADRAEAAKREAEKAQAAAADLERQVSALLAEGRKALSGGRAKEAEAAADRVLALQTANSDARALKNRITEIREQADRKAQRAQEEKVQGNRLIEEVLKQVDRLKRDGEDYKALVELRHVVTLEQSSPRAGEIRRLTDEVTARLNKRVERDFAEGSRLAAGGQLAPAIGKFDAVLRIFPEHPGAKQRLQAVRDRLSPLAKSLYEKGIVLEGMNDLEAAKDHWRKVLELGLEPENEYYRKAGQKLKGG